MENNRSYMILSICFFTLENFLRPSALGSPYDFSVILFFYCLNIPVYSSNPALFSGELLTEVSAFYIFDVILASCLV